MSGSVTIIPVCVDFRLVVRNLHTVGLTHDAIKTRIELMGAYVDRSQLSRLGRHGGIPYYPTGAALVLLHMELLPETPLPTVQWVTVPAPERGGRSRHYKTEASA